MDKKRLLWILIAFLIGFFLKFIIENLVCQNMCPLVEGTGYEGGDMRIQRVIRDIDNSRARARRGAAAAAERLRLIRDMRGVRRKAREAAQNESEQEEVMEAARQKEDAAEAKKLNAVKEKQLDDEVEYAI